MALNIVLCKLKLGITVPCLFDPFAQPVGNVTFKDFSEGIFLVLEVYTEKYTHPMYSTPCIMHIFRNRYVTIVVSKI